MWNQFFEPILSFYSLDRDKERNFCWDGHPAAKKAFQIYQSPNLWYLKLLYIPDRMVHIVDPPPSQSQVNVFRYSLLKVTKDVMSSWWSLWVHFWCSKVDWAISQPGYSPKTNASMSHWIKHIVSSIHEYTDLYAYIYIQCVFFVIYIYIEREI